MSRRYHGLKGRAAGAFDPENSHSLPGYARLQARVDNAEVILLGAPDYHGSISSAMKNILDHFWHEVAGKLFITIVAWREKGLTVTDQLRTVARQCYAWILPYGVAFNTEGEVNNGRIASETLRKRLEMLIRDGCDYGNLLARQRDLDLSTGETGFLARYRK